MNCEPGFPLVEIFDPDREVDPCFRHADGNDFPNWSPTTTAKPLPVNKTIPELPGLEVSVDDVMYMPNLTAPDDRPFPFVYFITIRNGSDFAVTIKARKWVVRQKNGEVIVVEGDGVVGQFPRLAPGGEFSYNSCHTVSGDSEAGGAYFVETDNGGRFCVRIPPFPLDLPQWV